MAQHSNAFQKQNFVRKSLGRKSGGEYNPSEQDWLQARQQLEDFLPIVLVSHSSSLAPCLAPGDPLVDD